METIDASQAARILGKRGGAKGGLARAQALTPAQRQASAQKAISTRWDPTIIRATHGSPDHPLRIGDVEIPCYVLSDGRRVVVQHSAITALGVSRGSSYKGGDRLANFVAQNSLKPFVSQDLTDVTSSPIRFRTPKGSLAYGYEATVLADICEAVFVARQAGKLTRLQDHIGEQCEILMRGFARVGIIALVDEVTGYQEDRDRQALHNILEASIAKELLPWTKRFPYAFYQHVFRLKGWRFNTLNRMQGPRAIAQITNLLVYEQLPPGVMEELRHKNPLQEDGRRKFKLHQFLTETIGNKHLEKHLTAVSTLLRIAETWEDFMGLFTRAFPRPPALTMGTDLPQTALEVAGEQSQP